MIKLKNILKEIKNDIHHAVPGFPEKSVDDEQLPANVNTKKHFTTTEPSKPKIHTKMGEPSHPYTSQHQISVTPQSAAETGTPYYIHQDYVNLLRQIYNKTLFKTKSQYEAEKVLQSAMKSDYYKDSILKKYHDRIEMERARIGREKSAAKAEKIQQAVKDALERAEEKVATAVEQQKITHTYHQDDGDDEYPWRNQDDSEDVLNHLAYRAGLGTEEYIRNHGVPRKSSLSNFENRLTRAAYRAGLGTEDYLTRNGHHV